MNIQIIEWGKLMMRYKAYFGVFRRWVIFCLSVFLMLCASVAIALPQSDKVCDRNSYASEVTQSKTEDPLVGSQRTLTAAEPMAVAEATPFGYKKTGDAGEEQSISTSEEFFEQLQAGSSGDKFYFTADSEKATNGDKRTATITEDIEVPAGVELILPINEQKDFKATASTGTAEQYKFAWQAADDKYLYSELTINGSLTINGTVRVGGMMYYGSQPALQGHTSSYYAKLVVNGDINIESNGELDVYGLLKGTGSVEVKSGGTLLHPFVVCDFMGGTITTALYGGSECPFNRFTMPNIQCDKGYTAYFGSHVKANVQLYASSNHNESTVELIGGEETMFYLNTESSKVTVKYTDENKVTSNPESNDTNVVGKTSMTFEGGAKYNSMKLEIKLSFAFFPAVTIDTAPVFFPIPFNYDIQLNGDGSKYEFSNKIRILPGATLTIGEGATLSVLSSTGGLQVYDGLDCTDTNNSAPYKMGGKWYPLPDELRTGGYSTHGNLIVNGTLEIKEGATFVGVAQTEGDKGKITLTADAVVSADETYGGTSGSNCNKVVRSGATARGYDAAHSVLVDLKADSTYTSKMGASFGIPSYDLTKLASNVEGHTAEATGLKGSWAMDHEEDQFDEWNVDDYKDSLLAHNNNSVQTITRQCTVMGCEKTDEATVAIYLEEHGKLGNLVYDGENIQDSDIKGLFNSLYADGYSSIEEAITVNFDKEFKDVGTHQVTVNLGEGFFWFTGAEEAYKLESSHTFEIEVKPYTLNDGMVEEFDNLTYKGSAYDETFLKSQVKINFNGAVLTESDFDLEIEGDSTNKGTFKVKIKGKDNFDGEVTKKVKIDPRSVTDNDVTLVDADNLTYDGTQKTPNVSVTVDELLPEITTDYTVTYEKNTDAGNATVKVTFKDNYSGEVTKTFTINKRNVTITINEQKVTYNGTDLKNSVSSEDDKWSVDDEVFGKDKGEITFTLSTDSATNAGSYDIKGAASGNKSGNYIFDFQGTNKFVIDPLNITSISPEVVFKNTYTYANQKFEPQQEDMTITANDLTLTQEDYEITGYGDNKNAGEGTVNIQAKRNFTGTFAAKFTIEKAKVTITADDKNSPVGQEALELTAKIDGVVDNDYEFTKDTDYKLEVNDKDFTKTMNTYDIVVTLLKDSQNGWDNYTVETKNGKYTVTAAIFQNIEFEGETVEYDGTAHTLDEKKISNAPENAKFSFAYFKGDGTAQSVEKESIIDAGDYTIKATISATHDNGQTYTMEITAKLVISPKKVIVHINEQSNEYNGSAFSATSNKGTDYTVDKGAFIERDEISVTLTASATDVGVTNIEGKIDGKGKDNYEVTFEGGVEAFKITAKQVNLEIKVQSVDYNRNSHEAQSVKSESYELNGVVEGDDVTVKLTVSGSAIDAGNYNITAVLEGAKAGNYSLAEYDGTNKFVINTLDLNDAEIVLSEKYTYTQNKIEPSKDKLTVTVKGIVLQSEEYSVSYGENVNAGKDAGSVTVTAANKNFVGEKTLNFDIAKKSIASAKVTVAETVVYNGKAQTPKVTITLEGYSFTDDDYETEYSANTNAGEATVTVTAKGNNFEGSANGTFEIEKATVTVTPKDINAVYGDAIKDLDYDVSGLMEGEEQEENDIDSWLDRSTDATENCNAGEYTITFKLSETQPSNYNVVLSKETANYNVAKKEISIEIEDQTDEFGFGKKYSFVSDAWNISEGQSFVGDDGKEQLAVTLTAPQDGADADTYEIDATSTSENYEVTVAKKGKYTVTKKDVSDQLFVLLVNGSQPSITDGIYKVPFAGEPLTVSASVAVMEGDSPANVTVKVDPETIDDVGEFTITATVESKNYSGSKEFTVVAEAAENYTAHLEKVIEELISVADGLTAEDLTAADFDKVKRLADLIETLSEDEMFYGEERIAPYKAIVDKWNGTNIDAVIAEAVMVADAPISWLAETIATVSALLSLAYIIMKGGLL